MVELLKVLLAEHVEAFPTDILNLLAHHCAEKWPTRLGGADYRNGSDPRFGGEAGINLGTRCGRHHFVLVQRARNRARSPSERRAWETNR